MGQCESNKTEIQTVRNAIIGNAWIIPQYGVLRAVDVRIITKHHTALWFTANYLDDRHGFRADDGIRYM